MKRQVIVYVIRGYEMGYVSAADVNEYTESLSRAKFYTSKLEADLRTLPSEVVEEVEIIVKEK